MKKIVLLLSTLLSFLFTNPLSAQDFSEDFNFSGALTANSWTAHSAAGTNAETKAILGDHGATINFTSESLTASLIIKDTVFPVGTGLCGITSPINKMRAAIPSQNTYTGSVVTLAGRVTSKFGTNKFYLQDNTGGIAVFSASGSTLCHGVVVGDSVQVTFQKVFM